MKQLRAKKTRDVSCSKKEPLAEGLQIVVPTDSAGRRVWSKMSDEQIVELAKKVMEENGITGRKKLINADRGLYSALHKRRLLDKVEFEDKLRFWNGLSDDDIVEFARKTMEENEISGRSELEKADSGLYSVLGKRGLLDEIGIGWKRKLWKDISDDEIVEFAKKVMEENVVSGRTELKKADTGLYEVLRIRGLLGKVGFEEKQRSWKVMSEKKIIMFTKEIMKENEISSRTGLIKVDSGLYRVLRIRGLLGKVGFEEKKRSWENLSNEDIVELAKKVIKEKGITERNELINADRGLYKVLYERGLVDRAFANIDQQRNDRSRNAVIDALEAFGATNDNNLAEDDVA
ncbi:MAG: hypothetical protein ABH983_02730 [Candidatus Micrarchaeota archaeon]